MSIKVMTTVWNTNGKELKGSARLLMLAIADNANDDGYAYPGIDHLVKKTGIGRRQVMRLIQQCETDGWIQVERSANKVNRYYIQIDKLEESHSDILSPSLSGDNMSPEESLSDNLTPGDNLSRDTHVTTQVTPMSPEPSINLITTSGSISSDNLTPENGTAAGAVYQVYQDNIGQLNSVISQEIGYAIDEYGAEWIIDAITEAVKSNVLKWNYISAILERWQTEGRGAKKTESKVTETKDGGFYV